MNILYSKVAESILDIKECKRTDVFLWGADNAFPATLEALINMSVTAKACTNKGAKAIYGGAFGEAGDIEVNSAGEKLNEVFRIACGQYENQNNAWLHVTYDANLDIATVKCIPVTDPRIGKADDYDYSGKILTYSNWQKQKGKKFRADEAREYDRFNPNKDIITAQILAAATAAIGRAKAEKLSIQDQLPYYRGQILHIKKESVYPYAMPKLITVMRECLLEYNAQLFRSNGADEGFLNAKLAVFPKMDDDGKRKQLVDDIKAMKGAEGSSSLLAIELEQSQDDVSKQIFIGDLASEYNDTLLSNSEDRAKQNICIAQDVPYILIGKSDNTVFGESGAAITEAQNQLWNDRQEERIQMEDAFNKIASRFSEPIDNLTIVNPYEEGEDEADAKNINKEAQAKLRGTSGGADTLSSIIKDVTAGVIPKSSGVAMVKNIFGFSKAKAEEFFEDVPEADVEIIREVDENAVVEPEKTES